MGIGLPPGMYPMVYDPSMYNLPRGPPEMRRIDGEFGGQDVPPLGAAPAQDLRYTNRIENPFPTEKDAGYPPHAMLPTDPA